MCSKCPCCGEFSLPMDVKTGDICPNCFWEYDRIQQNWMALLGIVLPTYPSEVKETTKASAFLK